VRAFEPFHIVYRTDRGGQIAEFGGDEWLLAALDSYGSGLMTEGNLALGGPLFIKLRKRELCVIAWLRGLTVRTNAYEAWGVVGSSEADATVWVSYWRSLASEPNLDRLKQMASGLNNRVVGSERPEVPRNLSQELARVYLEHSSGTNTFLTCVRDPDDIALLPWLWLLGPIPSNEATIGPPRQSPLSLTYQGEIGFAAIVIEPCKQIEHLVQSIAQGQRFDSVLKSAHTLRLNPPYRTTSVLPIVARTVEENLSDQHRSGGDHKVASADN
jgi:hypothetical protein